MEWCIFFNFPNRLRENVNDFEFSDTAGQVEFTAMRDQYMRCGEGFIICYSVTDRHSFQEASEYRKLIARVRLTDDVPLVLIANKLDLQSQRKVSSKSFSLIQAIFFSMADRRFGDQIFFFFRFIRLEFFFIFIWSIQSRETWIRIKMDKISHLFVIKTKKKKYFLFSISILEP